MQYLSSKDYEAIKKDLDPFINETLPEVTKDLEEGDQETLQQLFHYEIKDTNSLAKAERNLIKAKMNDAKSDFGLEFRADYLENLQEGIFDLQGGVFYKRRAQMGVEWDILNGGLLDNNSKAKTLEKELELKRMEKEKENKAQAYSHLFNTIIAQFNDIKYEKLEIRKRIISQRLAIERKLYKADLILWDQLVETLSHKNEINHMISNYENYNKNINPKTDSLNDPENLPVVDINLDKVLEDIQDDAKKEAYIMHKETMLDHKQDPARELSLSPYFRYNFYNNPNNYQLDDGRTTPNRKFFSYGISFSAPIKFDYKETEALKQARLDKARAKLNNKMQNDVKEVLNSYYEYQYAMSDYIEFYHKRAKILEKIRQEKGKAQLGNGDHSPVKLLKLMDDLAAVNFELYEIQQKAYLKLLNIYTKVSFKDITQITEEIDVKEADQRFEREKGLYIWSDGFANKSNKALLEFLMDYEITQLALSLGPNNELAGKAGEFIPMAENKGIDVHLMIGNNSLFFKGRRGKIDDLLANAKNLGAKGIHLDVEPHARADFEANEQDYLDKWVDMIRYTRNQTCNTGLEFSVSIPIWYDQSIFKDIYPETDKVYIMAYKRKDVNKLQKRLNKELKVNKHLASIALRAKDFNNKDELHQMMGQLNHSTQINNYIIHKLESFEKLNENRSKN